MEDAKKLSSEIQQQADTLLLEKSTLELEVADLRRQCNDLKEKAANLTVKLQKQAAFHLAVLSLCRVVLAMAAK